MVATAGTATGAGTASVQLATQIPGDGLEVHEVAEARAGALSHLVLAAAGLPEVGDGGELGVDRPSAEPAVVELLDRLLRVLLLSELDVDVADEMVAEVVADVHLFDLSVLVLGLNEHVLEEVVVMFLGEKKIYQTY